MYVEKRNGSRVGFEFEKVKSAVERAFAETGEKYNAKKLFKALKKNIDGTLPEYGCGVYTVEQIQDIVETTLMEQKYYDTAKAYVRYRYQHELARQKKKENKIEDKIFAKDVKNQNANVDEHSFGGRYGEAAAEVLREYALEHLLSPMARDNHLNNEIYIHDLDHYALGDHNCLSVPFDKLLANGFNVRQTDVRPANSVNTAFQLVAVIFQLQSLCNFGGVSATHIDWTMVPYVRKSFSKHFKDGMLWCEEEDGYTFRRFMQQVEDGEWPDSMSIEDIKYQEYENAYEYALGQTVRETHQAVEGMYHNLSY